MRSKYQQIIQDEVHKQKLTVRATMGRRAYLKRMSSEKWSRPWMDYTLADALLAALDSCPDKEKAGRVRCLIQTLREKHTDELATYTKQQYDRDATYSNVDNFFTSQKEPFVWNDNFKVAFEIVRLLLRSCFTGNLKPLKISKGMNLTDILSTDDTAMGFLLLDSKKRDNPELLINTALRLQKEKPMDGNVYAVYTRHQLGGGVDLETGELLPETLKHKHRAVMGVCGAMSLVEATIAKPFTKHVLSKCPQYAGAKSPDEINDLLQHWLHIGSQWTSIDYSKFDQTIPSWLIEMAFELVKMFYPNTEDKELIDWLCYNFIHAKILYHDGSTKQKHKGISSGSQFTQIIGSLCNMLMVLTYLVKDTRQCVNPGGEFDDACWRTLHFQLCGRFQRNRSMMDWKRMRMMVMGDDNIFFMQKPVSKKDLAGYLNFNFGTDINDDKTEQQDATHYYPEFLKRVWYPDGAYRNIFELILNMILPERERTYKDYTPWEIIYGYMVTYPKAFVGLWMEQDIVTMMGGSQKLDRITGQRLRDLPGSLRVLLMTRPKYLANRIRIVRKYVPAQVSKTAITC